MIDAAEAKQRLDIYPNRSEDQVLRRIFGPAAHPNPFLVQSGAWSAEGCMMLPPRGADGKHAQLILVNQRCGLHL